MNKLIIGLILGIFIGSCGKAESDSVRASLVMSPVAGYRCFIIYAGTGAPIGGNCVKD